jgi:predicted lipoprotein with Yx(FWY)xxD motif
LAVVQSMRLSIRHSVTAALAIGTAAVALAACGSGDGGDNGKASAADPGSDSGIVSIQSVEGTDVLVDSEGRTLYSAQVEKGGRIRCTGACESFWDPVGASATEAPSASADLDLNLGVVKRPDGSRQLAFKRRPLYSFKEEGPGQLKGDGFVDDFEGTHFEWKAATVRGGSGSAGSASPSDSSPY